MGPILSEIGPSNPSAGHAANVTAKPGKSKRKKPNLAQRYINTGKKVVYSKDVEKLYPSIKSRRAGQLVKEEVQKTSMTFTNINYPMALRYISKSAASQEEVNSWGFGKW